MKHTLLSEILYDVGMPNKKSSLRDLAIIECNAIYDGLTIPPNQSREHTLLFLGSSGAGKSSLIMRFLEREESAKQTLALEYTYGRKARKSLVKDICHIWELGGKVSLLNLIHASLASISNVENLTVILMLDLSEPQNLWFTLEMHVKAILSAVHRKVGKDMEKLRARAWTAIGRNHPDREFLDPFPVPLIILGSKYDKFKDFDPEKKKAVCRTLRYVAHTLGATLMFYSLNEPGLVKKAKDILSHYGFGSSPIKSISQDYNKPLIIPSGADSMQQIAGLGLVGMPPRSAKMLKRGPGAALEHWKYTFTAYFPQETTEKSVMPDDPCNDINYMEPVIDNLRKQKEEELQLYCKEAERKTMSRSELDLEPWTTKKK